MTTDVRTNVMALEVLGNDEFYVCLVDFYTGERPNLETVQVRLEVNTDDADLAAVPVTRDECYRLADAFLRVANNWPVPRKAQTDE